MATTGISSELSCLVCNSNVDMSSCINMYYTSLPRNGETLASFVLRIIRPNTSDLRSSYICLQCYHLFQMLEQAQYNVANIRSEILKVYQSGEKKKLMKETMNGTVQNAYDEKNFILDFAHVEKLEIANALCHIQDTYNLREEPKTHYVQESLIEDSLDSINADLSLVDKSRTSSSLDATNTAVPSNLRNVSNDAQDNYSKFKKSEESNKVTLESLQSFVDNTETSIPQETLKEATKEDSVRNKEKQNTRCQLCNRSFKSTKSYELHLSRHGESRPYQCQICMTRFTDFNSANIHCVKIHPKEKPCIDLIFKSCENTDNLVPENLFKETDSRDEFNCNDSTEDNNHSTDTEKTKFTQNSLDNVSSLRSTKSSQMRCKSDRISKYSQKPLKHMCPTCNKKWRTQAELKTHMKSHSNLRPYMCEKCGQAYKHKHALEVHIGMHNGINPFQCSFCNKCFTQKGALMRHLPIHTGETPYQCELCGKRFVHHTSYNMHALSHTGKKSYRCDICDLALLSTSHLKRHMRVHTGEKPYSCSLCGKRFAERYNLFAHQKIHDPLELSTKESKNKSIKCEQCDASFESTEKFQEHAKKNHNLTTNVSNSWIGHTIEVEPKPLIIDQVPKFYTTESQNQKVESQNADLVDQWVDLNYSKPRDLDHSKMIQTDSSIVQINSSLENQKMFTNGENYDRSYK